MEHISFIKHVVTLSPNEIKSHHLFVDNLNTKRAIAARTSKNLITQICIRPGYKAFYFL